MIISAPFRNHCWVVFQRRKCCKFRTSFNPWCKKVKLQNILITFLNIVGLLMSGFFSKISLQTYYVDYWYHITDKLESVAKHEMYELSCVCDPVQIGFGMHLSDSFNLWMKPSWQSSRSRNLVCATWQWCLACYQVSQLTWCYAGAHLQLIWIQLHSLLIWFMCSIVAKAICSHSLNQPFCKWGKLRYKSSVKIQGEYKIGRGRLFLSFSPVSKTY